MAGAISTNHEEYRRAKQEAGTGLPSSPIPEWLHFYFALHVHYALDATEGMHGTPEHVAGTHFGLVRNVHHRTCTCPIWQLSPLTLNPHLPHMAGAQRPPSDP